VILGAFQTLAATLNVTEAFPDPKGSPATLAQTASELACHAEQPDGLEANCTTTGPPAEPTAPLEVVNEFVQPLPDW
jgi:hypothetical protein